jgi:hypothetical protein
MLHKDLKSTFFSFFIRYDAKKFATYPKNLTFAQGKTTPARTWITCNPHSERDGRLSGGFVQRAASAIRPSTFR